MHPATFDLRRCVSTERSILHHAFKHAEESMKHLAWQKGLSPQGREIFEQSKRDLEDIMNDGAKATVIPTSTYRIPNFSVPSDGFDEAVAAAIEAEVSSLRADRNDYVARISRDVIRAGARHQFVEALVLLAGLGALEDLKQVMPDVFPTDC